VEAGREIFWNIGFWGNLIYVFLSAALALLIWMCYRRYRLWRTGRPDSRSAEIIARIPSFVQKLVTDILGQQKILEEPLQGILHLILFWSFVSFFALSIADFVHHYFFPFLSGWIYLWFSVVVDIFGILALFALLGFAAIRYIQRPRRLDNQAGDTIDLILLFLLILTGFLVEGSRLAVTEMVDTPDYAPWSFGGWILGKFFIGLGSAANRILHQVWWILHLILVLTAVVYVSLSFSKLIHILTAPINIFFRSLRPRGELLPIDFEVATEFGVGRINDFTWKQLLDLDACTRCGRCQDSCPAHLSGKVLSPKNIIQDLKTELEQGWRLASPLTGRQAKAGDAPAHSLINDVISQEALWDCTTCVACVEVCPVYVEHVDKMIDMRRGQVLADKDLPGAVRETLRNMEIRGNPWRGADYLKDEWTGDLDVNVLSGGTGSEWLYWVGCTGALIDRNILVTRSLSGLLKDAGTDFGILGNEEGCCGDPARRMGHELQFQMMAKQNIEIMNGYGVKKIVTHCPHCYNTLKHEYPQFGGRFDVWHHSELLNHLIRDGKLTLTETVDKVVTYHDPCYLGRYNQILDAPRNCLQAISGLERVEMEQHGYRSFCCGGGGGHAWMEENTGRRINRIRMDQALQTKAEIIGVACPFCLQMVEEAVGSLDTPVKAMDLCEIIALSKAP